MLTDISQAPILESDGVFQPAARNLLSTEAVMIKGTPCAWVETAGTLLVDGAGYAAVATLVPVESLTVPVQQGESEPRKCAAHPDPTVFPKVHLDTGEGSGLLDALALIFTAEDTKRLHAYVFNGYMDDLVGFDSGDSMADAMDTVVAMFSVIGTGGGSDGE